VTDRFRRNGARAWLGRVLGAFALALVLAAGMLAAAALGFAGPSARPADLLVAFSGLSLVLNLAILAAFAVGALLVLGWLARAAREEAAVNRFFRDNEEALRQRGPGGVDLAALHLEGLGRTAVRERVELLSELQRAGAGADAAVLSEALLDREEPRVQVARYTAGTLVLLGLLGTFVGLLLTIGGVAEVVEGLGVTPDGDLEAFLVQLKVGLRSPLEGMGLAFSTSLLGLTGSLLLGVGALGLSAAQSSWISKLEEATALYLVAAPPWSARLAAPEAPAASAAVAAASSGALLREAEAVARLFRQAQAAASEHAARVDGAAGRMAAAAEDLRERVGALVAQVERVELALARVVDAGGGQREVLNDLGVKLAELTGAAAAARAELRDGQEGAAGRLQAGLESLRQGLADALASLSQQDLARREEARRAAELLAGILEAAGGRPESAP
jgi:hypothetical protein